MPDAGGVRSRDPDRDVPAGYSKDIYTADLKLPGLLPRLGLKPGIARYLLVSGTFGTKGYRSLRLPDVNATSEWKSA